MRCVEDYAAFAVIPARGLEARERETACSGLHRASNSRKTPSTWSAGLGELVCPVRWPGSRKELMRGFGHSVTARTSGGAGASSGFRRPQYSQMKAR